MSEPEPTEKEEAPDDGDGPSEDAVYMRAILTRAAPRSEWKGLLFLVVTIAAFAYVSGFSMKPRDVAMLVVVLLVHELGHWVGMRAFGYRDVRMFFIPFFGAAVSGTPQGVSSTKRAIVLLLGPVPGIVLAAALAFVMRPSLNEDAGSFVANLVAINALNLLPFEPFDGGRLLTELVGSRSRVVEAASLVASAAGLAALAFHFRSLPFAFIAYLTAIGVRRRWASATAAAELRTLGHALPEEIVHAPEPVLRLLLARAEAHVKRGLASAEVHDKAIAAWCRDTYERARETAPSAAISVLFGAGALGALLLGALALLVVAVPTPGAVRPLTHTATSRDGHVHARLPARFKVIDQPAPGAVKATRAMKGTVEEISIAAGPRLERIGVDERAARMLRILTQATDRRRVVLESQPCHRGDGRMFAFAEPNPSGREFHYITCFFDAGELEASYRITVASELYDAELPVLKDIAEAAEITP